MKIRKGFFFASVRVKISISMINNQVRLRSTMLAKHLNHFFVVYLLASLLQSVAPVYAEDKAAKKDEETIIYKSKNRFGHTVYSDQSSDDAEQIELNEPSEYDGVKVNQELSRANRRVQSQPTATQPLAPYERLSILNPKAGETIRNNSGNITISTSVSPAIRSGHLLQVMLDGAPIASASGSTNLQNLDRGTHQISVRVIQANNQKVFQEGSTVSFTLLRHSILNKSSQN